MNELFNHQRAGINKIISRGGAGALFWDTGTGKTRAALEIFKYYKGREPELQLLVVCPISLIESSWADDIKKFYAEFTYENLRTSQNLTADILLINYESIISKKFVPVLQCIKRKTFMVVADESQKIKSYNAKTTKCLLAIARSADYRVVMSATPAPNSEMEYWSQMCFLHPNILGDNFFQFRNKYFCLIRGRAIVPLYGLGKREIMTMMQRGYEMGVHPSAVSMIKERMAPFCMFVNKREVLDLPEEVDVFRKVEMTPEQKKSYKEMWDELVTEIQGQEISVNLALAKIMKVRQITGGFIYGQEGAIEFEKNPKMQELKEVVEGIRRNSIIIFCQYRWEIEKISEIFKERAVKLYGETKDKEGAIREFRAKRDGILVTHPLSAGIGLSFNECDYMVFYSLSYSFLEYYQCRGRIMRAGKQNRATYIHIIAKDSIDEVIYKALQNKEESQEIYRKIKGEKK